MLDRSAQSHASERTDHPGPGGVEDGRNGHLTSVSISLSRLEEFLFFFLGELGCKRFHSESVVTVLRLPNEVVLGTDLL
jgi:hypothetical protein